MIKVKINKNEIIIKGHANFDDYGKDIVCASCSSIVTASVNDMMVVNKDAVSFSDNGNEMIIKMILDDDLVNKLFNNLKELLISLYEDYPKNIIVTKEE
jgi:uncharacterized protein